jgi:outer membrane protein OmpA-like peptidoglycan-associated protein
MIKIIPAMTLACLITIAACKSISPKSSPVYELPPCAQPQPVPQRSYIVFFDQHSAVVTPRGTRIIQQFDNEFSIFSDLDVFIEASTDTSETSHRDRGLDMRRGEAVARLIKQFGISSDSRIHIVAIGTKSPLVPTPPLTPEPQNRSAILFARGGKQIRPDTLQSECLSWLREHQCGPQVSDAQKSVCVQVQGVAGAFSR